MIASVVLPSYNRADALRLTLGALAEQTAGSGAFEVIVVDDGSADGCAEGAVACEPALHIRLLRQDNRGPGAARNLGARHAAGELLIFLDADMIPAAGLVEAYRAAFSGLPAAVHVGRILVWPGAFETLFDRATGVERQHDLGTAPRQLEFYHLASGNFAIGAEPFRRLGGFDEELRMTEDTDLGFRAGQTGVPLSYCAGAVGYHNHPKTLDERCAYVERSAFWTARLLAKHPQMAPLLPIYQDILPLHPSTDPIRLTARKLGRRVLALPGVQGGLRRAIGLLEAGDSSARLLSSLYWKALSGCRVAGFREGRSGNASARRRTSA